MQEMKSKVLIIDDSKTARMILRQALEDISFVVYEAENGQKAVEIFPTLNLDIILLDVEMPGLDGFETCTKLRSLPAGKNIPIVMVTGTDDITSINKAYAVGATDFITKPINWNLIGHRILYIIRSGHNVVELQKSQEDLIRSQDEIKKLNDDLEKRVKERTLELNNTNKELKKTLDSLRSTQNQLIESEKMAYIGTLVASMSHEANVPIQSCITSVFDLDDKLQQVDKSITKNELKKSQLEDFIKSTKECMALLESNLPRAFEVIKSFKDISVDHISESMRFIILKDYIEEILFNLDSALKEANLTTSLNCPDSLKINSYPSILFRIISTLVMNSIKHAYEPGQNGHLTITVTSADENITILYADDGKGIPKEFIKTIFDPYVPSRESVGMGLHIIYRQITQLLNGKIECKSEVNQGTTFIITLPNSK